MSNCDIGGNYYWMMTALDDYKVWNHLMTARVDDCKVRWFWYLKKLSFDDQNRQRQKTIDDCDAELYENTVWTTVTFEEIIIG